MKKHTFKSFALILSLTTSLIASAQETPRPTQYVVLAFDGSKNLDFWNESRDFAKNNNLKFTYFISGVYWLSNGVSKIYKNPNTGTARSCIGYGETAADVQKRVEQVNLAYLEKNEIASHANGHCEGAKSWNQSQWDSEFSQFNKFIFETFKINGFAGTYNFKVSDVVGFRAPFLAYSSAMWDTLKSFGYRYDTSKSDSPNYWPKKINTIWNFPLGRIGVAGTAKKTLSMDYNFYVTDSGGKPDPANSEIYYKRMLNSYKTYFENNYFGNRAPLHIGHHFSKWNNAAYWRAMQDFAKSVCNLPETKCITYDELADEMDKLSDSTIAAYQAGKFPKLERPLNQPLFISSRSFDANSRFYDLELKLQTDGKTLQTLVSGKDAKFKNFYKISYELNRESIKESDLSIEALGAKMQSKGSELSVVAKTKDGIEIQRSTHMVFKDVGAKNLFLGEENLENRSLMGDLPEAHNEDEEAHSEEHSH